MTSASSESPSSSTSLDSWHDPHTGEEVLLLGLRARHLLEKAPVSLTVSFEAVEGIAQVDKRSRCVYIYYIYIMVSGVVYCQCSPDCF